MEIKREEETERRKEQSCCCEDNALLCGMEQHVWPWLKADPLPEFTDADVAIEFPGLVLLLLFTHKAGTAFFITALGF